MLIVSAWLGDWLENEDWMAERQDIGSRINDEWCGMGEFWLARAESGSARVLEPVATRWRGRSRLGRGGRDWLGLARMGGAGWA